MATFLMLDDRDLTETALCCRVAAFKSRQDAEAQNSIEVKATHLRTAEFREELAKRYEEARSHPPLR